jgi:hypothetical protein
MRLLDLLVAFFVQTFSITEPTPAARRRVGWFILALLLLAVAIPIVIGWVGYGIFPANR